MNCSKVEELEDIYLLGELEEETAAELEQHLAECPDCGPQIAASREALGRLFVSVQPVAPPDHVRSALLEKIKATPAPLDLATARPRRRKVKQKFSWLSFAFGVGVAAAMLLLSMGFWLVTLQNNMDTLALQRNEAQRLLDYTSSADTRVWTMFSEDRQNIEAPRARLYIRPGSDYLLVTASKLPQVAVNKSYRVWMVRIPNDPSSKPELVTKLAPDSQGRASAIVNNPSRNADASTCFVTLEGEAVTEPTGPKLLIWNQT